MTKSRFIVIQESLNESYGPFLNEMDAYYHARKINGVVVPLNQTRSILKESTDSMTKNEIKDFVKSEMEKFIHKHETKQYIQSIIETEFMKLIKKQNVKDEIFDLSKDFTKKFYKDLALNTTYIIDRIK